MRQISACCAATVLVSFSGVFAQDLPAERAALIAEALRLRAEVGDTVWPGFGAIETPIVLLDGDREWLIGHPADVEGFEPAGALAALHGSVQVGARTIQGDLAAAFPAHGTPAVVISTPEAMGWSPTQWVTKTVHEMFHVMQMQRGEFAKIGSLAIAPPDADPMWQLNFPFPYDDATARALLHQQAWPCYIGAEALEEDEARYAAGVAVESAGALRAWLESSAAPVKSAEYASMQEWKEGVAKWVERETARRAVGSPQAPAFASLDGAAPYEDLWRDEYADQRYLAKHAGRASASRTIFYHLGLAKAMLLERLDPTWKEVYFKPDVWLDDMLERAAAGIRCNESGESAE